MLLPRTNDAQIAALKHLEVGVPLKLFLQGLKNTKRQKWYVRLWNNKDQFEIFAFLVRCTA